jgi:hypothetical protein
VRRRTNWHSIVRWRAETAGRDRAVLGWERGEDGGVAAERAEEVRAANGRATGVRVRGGAAAPDGRPTEPSWLGRDAGSARGREPESNRFKNTKKNG